MRIAEVIKQAREKISDPKAWCQTNFALDADGNSVLAHVDKACQWCALGAVYAVLGKIDDNLPNEASNAVEDTLDTYVQSVSQYQCITNFNDALTTRHSDVIEVMDKVVDILENGIMTELFGNAS